MESAGSAAPQQVEHEERMARLERLLINKISSLSLTRPEMLRSVAAAQPLQFFGRALRGDASQDLHGLSRPTQEVAQFWSHSWHGKTWRKIMLLIYMYSGHVAMISSLIVALIFLFLASFQVLPSYDLEYLRQGGNRHDGPFIPWCAGSGLVTFLLVFFLWRPQKEVFVDRICIHQHETRLKTEGILNVGGILKNSKSMLVLFDSSYAQRLWCIYELAAFLKAHEGEERALIVRPTALAPGLCISFWTIVLFSVLVTAIPADNKMVAWGLIVVAVILVTFWVSWALRIFYRELKEVEAILKDCKVSQCRCYCCDVNHVHPTTKSAMEICDREILLRGITMWFGSVETFEQMVSSKVSTALMEQLGINTFPYSWMLVLGCPFCWNNMDRIVANVLAEDYKTVLELSCLTVVGWLCIAPVFIRCAMIACRRLSDRQSSRCRDLLATAACGLSPVPAVLTFGVAQVSLNQGIPYYGVVIYMVLSLIATALVWTYLLNPTATKAKPAPSAQVLGHVSSAGVLEELPVPTESRPMSL
ncbi:unnamed protein product [Durusdinium trenchii]|uniref:TIR domain-containing protein n=2 Tax=Durusdinium trenchii TaxID=1381693 RepID=A0ABP0LZ20_9DINO